MKIKGNFDVQLQEANQQIKKLKQEIEILKNELVKKNKDLESTESALDQSLFFFK